jgi:hypothetical protein
MFSTVSPFAIYLIERGWQRKLNKKLKFIERKTKRVSNNKRKINIRTKVANKYSLQNYNKVVQGTWKTIFLSFKPIIKNRVVK